MPIVFAPLEAIQYAADADGSVFVHGSALAALTLNDGAYSEGEVFVFGSASAMVIAPGEGAADGSVFVYGGAVAANDNNWSSAADGVVYIYGSAIADVTTGGEPAPGAYADGSVYVSADIEAAEHTAAESDGDVFVFGDGWAGGGAVADGSSYIDGEALESLDILVAQTSTIVTYFPWMYGLAGGAYERVVDTLVLDVEGRAEIAPWVRDMVAATELQTSRADARSKAQDALAAAGVEAVVMYAVTHEGLSLEGLISGDYLALERVVESLLVGGDARSVAEAVSKTADVLVAVEIAQTLMVAGTADTMALEAAADYAFTAIERVIDQGVLFSAERTSLSVVVRDSMAITSEALSSGEFIGLVRDGMAFVGRFRLDTGEYVAWTINTESAGVSRYTNYPFNSFAQIGQTWFGMTSTGVFSLDADDDEGEPIASRIRVGMSDLGTRLLKTVTEAYLGFTADGGMLLRTITPNPETGALEAANYRLRAVGAASVREQRYELGKGVKAVDWDFEIENIDGADFELHSLEVLPIKMSRRTRN